MLRKTAVLLITVLICCLAAGSPARRGSFLLTQPDGTSFMASVKGDEFCRVLTTADGCALTKGDDGYYQYAFYNADGSKVRSGYRVGDQTPALVLNESRNIPYTVLGRNAEAMRLERALRRPSKKILTKSGQQTKRCLIILVDFPDLQMQETTRKSDFTKILATKGTGTSAIDYYTDQLGDIYDFEFTVTDVVTVSKNHDYYGKDTEKAGSDAHPDQIVTEACRLLDSQIDFSQYDQDGDGEVDNVFVIVAGRSQAEGGDTDFIWPHQWYVQEKTVLDGKTLGCYAMSTELSVQSQKSSGQLVWGIAQIGTFCHEYGHTFGLLDLYDTDSDGSGGESDCLWSTTALMDHGNYNNLSKTPPSFNAIDYEFTGGGKCETLHAGTYTLAPISESKRYLIWENPADEYEFYLFECRSQSGWDTYIGGSGLAIYHIDMSESHNAGHSDKLAKDLTAMQRWENNEVNCNPEHQCADMVETTDGAIAVEQAFYPYKGKSSFTVATVPAFVFNDGTQSTLSISNIQKSGNNVTFTVYDSEAVIPNVTNLKYEPYQDAVIVTWESDVEESLDTALVTWGQTSKSTQTVKVAPYEPGKYSMTVEGLSPTTSYSFSLMFSKGGATGDSESFEFLTKSAQSGKRPFIYLEYIPYRDEGGFQKGVGLPLRAYNAVGSSISWYYNGQKVTVDKSGYYHPTASGTLKAVMTDSSGKKIILAKEISIL